MKLWLVTVRVEAPTGGISSPAFILFIEEAGITDWKESFLAQPTQRGGVSISRGTPAVAQSEIFSLIVDRQQPS